MPRRILLQAEGATCEAVAAFLLGFLAYPDDKETAKRDAAIARLHGQILWHGVETGRLDPDSLSGSKLAAISFACRSRAGFISLERRLQHRLAAGNGAAALLFHSIGLTARFPDDFGAPTLTNFLVWSAKTCGGEERNFEGRQWNNTMPVLNLAIAFCYLLEGRWRVKQAPTSILEFASQGDFVSRWVRLANALAPQVEKQWRGRKGAQNQPRFRFASAAIVQKLTVSASI
jgi:hypothetical protein